MPKMADRISEILDRIVAFREEEKSWAGSSPIRIDGLAESYRASELRLFAVGEYHLRRDVARFRSNLAEAATLYIDLFERNLGTSLATDMVMEVGLEELSDFSKSDVDKATQNAPADVLHSLLTMVTFKELFNALASGNRKVAERLSKLIGAHLDPEHLCDEPLNHYLGWSLKFLVDDVPDQVRCDWIGRLADYVQARRLTLMGYPIVMQAIVDRNAEVAQAGFAELLEGHRKECRAGKLFGDTEDEIVCVWGLGLANLARWRGLSIGPQDDLTPMDLLL
jgi:hypothetical protein